MIEASQTSEGRVKEYFFSRRLVNWRSMNSEGLPWAEDLKGFLEPIDSKTSSLTI